MNFTDINTDNLYIFLTLSGLVLIITSIKFYFSEKLSLENDLDRLEKESIKCGIDNSKVAENLIFLRNIYKIKFLKISNKYNIKNILPVESEKKIDQESLNKILKLEDEDFKNFIIEIEDIYKSSQEFKELYYKNKENKEIITNDLKRIQRLLNKLKVRKKIFVVLFIIGFLVSSFGFYFWYVKHQKYQDSLIRYKVENI